MLKIIQLKINSITTLFNILIFRALTQSFINIFFSLYQIALDFKAFGATLKKFGL